MAQFRIEDYPMPDTITPITVGDVTIGIKEYVPINTMLDAIESILSLSLNSDTGLYLPGHLEVYKTLYYFYLFTDLEFLEEEKDQPVELYNALVCAPFYKEVRQVISKNMCYDIFNLVLEATIAKMEKYQTSAYGILDSMKKDYDNLNLDFDALQSKLKNKEGLDLVDEVVKKLG